MCLHPCSSLFATCSAAAQRDWACAALRMYNNNALLDAIADSLYPQRHGYGDEAPQVAAIEPAEREAEAGDIIIRPRT